MTVPELNIWTKISYIMVFKWNDVVNAHVHDCMPLFTNFKLVSEYSIHNTSWDLKTVKLNLAARTQCVLTATQRKSPNGVRIDR